MGDPVFLQTQYPTCFAGLGSRAESHALLDYWGKSL
jgi:hypothetical protein